MSSNATQLSAETLLNNRAYIEGMAALRHMAMERIIDLDVTEKDEEHELCNLLRSAEMLDRILGGWARNGVIDLEEARKSVI